VPANHPNHGYNHALRFASERRGIIQPSRQASSERCRTETFFSGQNCFLRALLANYCGARGSQRSCKPIWALP
jgi:hypothetical protein